MLKITPYLGIIVLIVSIGGVFYPKLGYFLLLVFASLMIIAPFRGRWFCGNLCPRGSFADFWIAPISRKAKIPPTFRSMWIRTPIFVALMGFMVFRIIQTQGVVDKVGMVFVTMCILTTSVSILFGVAFAPRAWCSFCPMGTLQRAIGGSKHPLVVDRQKCIKCGKCQKVCPMQLPVKEIQEMPDCIKCGRCVEACPKGALSF
ncbi:MAG: quinol dehydrogenase membrane component [Methanosaeta sp. PtaB.Bin018]|jgi:polyferredoxin|nr:MAG: quinol dehydrogenase membrane component [Methanosaeta sp. PtaB.Bin018]OPY47739.1 MAG: quinol dehydrogenase membrane component [Methanosaeta sp. PtaU1.Bin016]HOV51778.1 4Fe-4S binding protein [Methanothrix sp.]